MREILISVSAGELIDKITILQIKRERIPTPEKLKNIERELSVLTRFFNQSVKESSELRLLMNGLRNVNVKLWEIEDSIRICERNNDFGSEFIELARSVYRTNDKRSEIKRKINILLNSEVFDEKQYEPY